MTPEGGAMRETKATSLIPETTSATQASSPLKGNKRSALAVNRGKEKARAKAGRIPGNNNNHNSNAARAVRVGEESRGGVIQGSRPKILNEGVPPSVERMGGHQRCPPCSNQTAARKKLKTEKHIPPYLNPRDKIQWWRDQKAGADLLCAMQVGVRQSLTNFPTAGGAHRDRHH